MVCKGASGDPFPEKIEVSCVEMPVSAKTEFILFSFVLKRLWLSALAH